MEKVAGYLCFINQSESSINFHIRQMLDWCLFKNYDCMIYFDKVKSRSDFNRKELNKLKLDIQNKKYSKLIIKDLTHLSKNVVNTLELLNFFDGNHCEVECMDGMNLKLYKEILNKKRR